MGVLWKSCACTSGVIQLICSLKVSKLLTWIVSRAEKLRGFGLSCCLSLLKVLQYDRVQWRELKEEEEKGKQCEDLNG